MIHHFELVIGNNHQMVHVLQNLSDLDDEILERLPTDVIEAINDGSLTRLPKSVVDSLPDQVSNSIPNSLIEAANANPVLALILVICGVIGIIGFLYGVFKSGIKTALFFGVVAACSWGFFATI